jgi:glycopeptide antibiotics resistance protein
MTPSRARRLLAVWICVFFVLVLPWTDLQDHAHWYKVEWPPRLASPRRVADVVGNVVLFMPFGFLVATAWQPRRRGVWPLGVCAALLLSASAEGAQLYSHSRIPSIADLASNVTGASIGLWLARRSGGQQTRGELPG